MTKRTEYKCSCGQSFSDGRARQGHIRYWNEQEPGKHVRFDPLVYQEGHEATQPVEVATAPVDPFFDFKPQSNSHSDLALAELAATVQAMRLELDALKQQRTVPVAAPEPVAPVVDQEAINLAQLDAMLGIDQPGPLEKKEAAIVAAVNERTSVTAQVAVPEPNQKKEIPRGAWLIVAFLSIAAIVALVIWQM